MGFFDDILNETVGRIPVVGGTISKIGGGLGSFVEKGVNTAGGLFSNITGMTNRLSNAATNLVGGMADFASTPYFKYILIAGGCYLAYTVIKNDGSSNGHSSSFISGASALAAFTPQGRVAGIASKIASAYV